MGFIEDERGVVIGVTYSDSSKGKEDLDARKINDIVSINLKNLIDSGVIPRSVDEKNICENLVNSGIIQKIVADELRKERVGIKSFLKKLFGFKKE